MQTFVRLPRRLILLTTALTIVGIATTSTPANASAQSRGLAVATMVDQRDAGFKDSVVRVRMILTNRNGDKSSRNMRLMTLESMNPNKGDKTLVVVDSPADVDGTILLTHAEILAPDDQWIFLPALKRVKRISSVNKSGPFMGSEFAYEDMGSQDVGKFDYLWLRHEPCPDVPQLGCEVVERTPLYEHSAYSRQIIWVDTSQFRILKTDFYDRKNTLLKTLRMTRYGLYVNQFWRAHHMEMSNHQTGKKTAIVTSEYQLTTGLDDGFFNKNNIDRIK